MPTFKILIKEVNFLNVCTRILIIMSFIKAKDLETKLNDKRMAKKLKFFQKKDSL